MVWVYPSSRGRFLCPYCGAGVFRFAGQVKHHVMNQHRRSEDASGYRQGRRKVWVLHANRWYTANGRAYER